MKRKRVESKPEVLKARLDPQWLGILAIVLVVFICYLPAINGGFLWDDPDYIRDNPLLRTGEGLVRIWTSPRLSPQWYPVTFTSFWTEYQLWGLNTTGYHLTNVLLHCGSALLFWRVLKRLEVPGALLAASVFALHPVMTESVAWMTERKNTLSLFLALATLHAWLRTRNAISPRSYTACLILFALALLSKSVVATLPAVMLVIVWWKEGRIPKREWLLVLPMLAMAIAMGSVTAYLEHQHVGASAALTPELELSLLQRIVIAGRVIWFYAVKLLLPVNQSFIYPRWEIPATPSMQLIAPLTVLIVLMALLLRHRKIGRGPFAAVAIFCGVLLPVLGFFNVYPMRFSFVADHFCYHASLSLIALISAGLMRLHKYAGFVILVPLAILSFSRATIYTDARTLWEDTHARNPSWMVKMNLGNAIRFGSSPSPSQLDRAEKLFREARDLKPGNAETHLLVGIFAGERGNLAEAESCFREAVRINPRHAESWYYLGEAMRFQKRLDEAIDAYDRALAINPDYELAKEKRQRALDGKGG